MSLKPAQNSARHAGRAEIASGQVFQSMSRTNYIFVDFENVQETDLDRIANKPVKVWLVLGERHKNLPVKLVKLIQKLPEQVQTVETELNGKNALDFVLACEIGIESQKDPNGYFHVLSRDKGFDALIKHLKNKKIHAARHVAFNEIPVLMNLEERVKLHADRWKANLTNRPKKRHALESEIKAFSGKILLQNEVDETIQKLIDKKIINLSETGVITYKI